MDMIVLLGIMLFVVGGGLHWNAPEMILVNIFHKTSS